MKKKEVDFQHYMRLCIIYFAYTHFSPSTAYIDFDCTDLSYFIALIWNKLFKIMRSLSVYFLWIVLFSCQSNQHLDEAVMFRKDAAHSAIYSNEDIPTLHGKKWKTKLDGNVFSSPVIYKDIVFIGSSSKFYALQAQTGSEIWSIPVDGPAHSSPTVKNDVVFFGDFSGKFYAVDVKNGTIKWTFFAKGERHFGAKGLHGMQPKDQYMVDDWDFYNSSPTIFKNNIYFGSGNGNVYALDLISGEEIWHFQTGDVVHASPAIAYDRVYIGSWDSYFYCLDAVTGTKLWDFQTGTDTVNYNQVGIQSSAIISDSTVYFGCRDAHLYAIDATNGEMKWKKFNNYSWIIVSPVVDDKNVYYTTSDSYQFFALNKHNGDSLYSLPTKGFGFSSPVRVNNMIFFGVFNGELVAIDTHTKSEVWRFHTDEALADEMKVLNEDGTLNGQQVFADFSPSKMPEIMDMMFSVGAILSTPVPYENSLIFGTANGYVYAIH